MFILGIETSCDETAASAVKDGKILSNVVASQAKLHKKSGGVVPEVAARAHVEKIIPVIEQALKVSKLEVRSIDAIAVTVGPGLLGSLIVGTETAKALGYALNKPVLPINHLEGHLVSAFAETISSSQFSIFNYLPALALIVSGGHTELVLIKKPFHYKIIGQTQDDAAGEAFDKIAKLLGLGYPGGAKLAALAAKVKSKNEKLKIHLPRPMIDSGDFNFSFSGLKTAVMYYLKRLEVRELEVRRAQIAAEVQEAVVDVLVRKTLSAAEKFQVKTILLGGGVSANERLRSRLTSLATNYSLLISPVALATDNAAMIAVAGYLRFLAGKRDAWYNIKVNPNLGLN